MEKQSEQIREIVVLGAGLVGTLLAILLKEKGFDLTLFEKRPDPRLQQNQEGRSINLALSERGLKALARAGLGEKLLEQAVSMKGRMVHEKNGELHFHPYGEEGKVIYSISRANLNKVLIDHAETKRIKIFFEHACKKVQLEKNVIELERGTHKETTHFNFEFLFGADGAFSALRGDMLRTNGFNYSQQYIDYGYKELHIPSLNGAHAMESHALHIWPRGEFMLIALPNHDGSFTSTLFLPLEGPLSFSKLQQPEQMHEFFSAFFPDVIALIPDLERTFFLNPPAHMVTIQCHPWVYGNNAALIGDAAHAIVPFFGQGMNAGFEDITVLLDGLEKGGTLESALQLYNEHRKKDTDAIALLALQNFTEMRDLVSDPEFVLRKKIEQKLHEQFPEYLSLYSMVTFTHMPYSDALESGQKQEAMFKEIFSLQDIKRNWETENGWKQIEGIFRKFQQS